MRLSILDYVPIFEDRSAHEAFQHSVELAQRAEQLGYMRYWVAEHHQVRSVASSAPEMVMMSLLEQTKKIRIGSGGVMLPHYSPYKVAEQFKIMEARHPRRVDMAIGRSPSFKNVNAALNENKEEKLDFETQLDDLNKYFSDNIDDAHRFKSLLATPLIPTAPEMYILGMSERSAKLAGRRGLPFVIAQMGQSSKSIDEVIKVYRDEYSGDAKPDVILATFVVTAGNDEKVERLLSALQLWLLRIHYLDQPHFYPSIETAEYRVYSDRESEKLEKNKRRIIYGTPREVSRELLELKHRYGVDELMILPHVYGEDARLELIELLAHELNLG